LPEENSMSANAETGSSESAAKQLAGFIAKYDRLLAKLARAARAALRKRFPTAIELVYDNYQFLAIGFGATERASDCIVSLAVSPKGVALSFYGGATLPGPDRILLGTENRIATSVLSQSPPLLSRRCAGKLERSSSSTVLSRQLMRLVDHGTGSPMMGSCLGRRACLCEPVLRFSPIINDLSGFQRVGSPESLDLRHQRLKFLHPAEVMLVRGNTIVPLLAKIKLGSQQAGGREINKSRAGSLLSVVAPGRVEKLGGRVEPRLSQIRQAGLTGRVSPDQGAMRDCETHAQSQNQCRMPSRSEHRLSLLLVKLTWRERPTKQDMRGSACATQHKAGLIVHQHRL
jgi:hypothetical protein